MYCAYKTINLINGRYYRGVTAHHALIEERKYFGSGLLICRVLKKYHSVSINR